MTTTARDAATPSVGSRQEQRKRRRRLAREQQLAVLVLLVAFVVTVVLLGLQWLHAGGSASSAPGLQHLFTMMEVV